MTAAIQSTDDALAALRSGDVQAALAFAHARLAVTPEDADAWAISGQASLQTGALADAAGAFLRAATSDPDNIDALVGLAEARVRMNDNAGALEPAKRARALAPDAIGPVFVLAPAAIAMRDEAATKDCFSVLQGVDEDTATALVDFWTQRLADYYRMNEAVLVYRSLLESATPTYHRLISYALLLVKARSPEQARPHVELAIKMNPNEGRGHLLAANIALQTGRLDDGAASARRAIACDDGLVSPYVTLASIDPSLIDDDLLAGLRRLTERADLSRDDRAAANLTLGAALEARGETDAAFDAFAAGNAHQREAQRQAGVIYDRAAVEARVAGLKALFTRDLLNRPSPAPDRGRRHVFIVGPPRSGSTLVDQALSSHSQVTSCGENGRMARIRDLFERSLRETGEDAADLIERRADEWAAFYGESLVSTDPNAKLVVDKLLDNFWSVGMIARLFPAAKIIVMKREPMDTCLSMFQLALPNDYSCATDLGDLGHFYRSFDEMTAYWADVLPNRVKSVDYEALVGDFEGVMTRVLADLGLEMEPAVIEFHANERAVFTLSAAQVRQGLTDSRLGRWRRYESHLAPLREALGSLAPA